MLHITVFHVALVHKLSIILQPDQTGGPGRGYCLTGPYILKVKLSSLRWYAPGNDTLGPGLPDPPPDTLTCPQAT